MTYTIQLNEFINSMNIEITRVYFEFKFKDFVCKVFW